MTDGSPQPPPASSLTDEEKRRLLHLAVTVREALPPTPKDETKSLMWKDILSSTVLSAVLPTLITVVLGGIIGGWLLNSYQQEAKRQERGLLELSDLLKQQEQVASSAYQLLGDARFHAAALMSLTAAPRPSGSAKIDKAGSSQRRDKIVDDETDFRQRWEKEKYTIGMQLGCFQVTAVRNAWDKARQLGEVMLEHAEDRWVLPGESIKTEEANFVDALNDFARTVESAKAKRVAIDSSYDGYPSLTRRLLCLSSEKGQQVGSTVSISR